MTLRPKNSLPACRVLLSATALVLMPAALADAATVKTEGGALFFTAVLGEANRLTVTLGEHDILFTDRGAHVRARGRCRNEGRSSARCPYPDGEFLIRLRDRDDRARIGGTDNALATDVLGGSGDDKLVGGKALELFEGASGRDELRGGGSHDILRGGGGADFLHGGADDDQLEGGAGVDDLRGGSGHDDVVLPRDRVRLDLRRQPVSVFPEQDRARGIEDAVVDGRRARLTGDRLDNFLFARGGGSRLVGNGGDDSLGGQAGRDVLIGGSGRDGLDAGAGRNTLRGGRGADVLSTIDVFYPLPKRPADRIFCGPGDDEIHAAPQDLVEGCESAVGWEFDLGVEVQPRVDGDEAIFQAACDRFRKRCQGTLRMRGTDGTAYGTTEFDIPWTEDHRASFDIPVPLTAEGKSAAARGARVEVRYRSGPSMTFSTAGPGAVLTFGYTTRFAP